MDRLSLSRAARQHEGVLIAPRQPIAGPFSAGKASGIDDSGKPELFTIPAGTQLSPDRRSNASRADSEPMADWTGWRFGW